MADIFVVANGLITPAGRSVIENWESLCAGKTFFKKKHGVLVAEVSSKVDGEINELRKDKYLKNIDRSALLAILASRDARALLPKLDLTRAIVLMGTSRGFVTSLEEGLQLFDREQRVNRYFGSVSHLACLSAAVAKDLEIRGLTFSLASACSSSLHCVGMAYLLMKQEFSNLAVVGGADAPLSPFTLAQLKDLGVLSADDQSKFPCRPLEPYRTGTVFGEGAASLILDINPSDVPLARVIGYGAAIENGLNPGVTQNGIGMQEAIIMALHQAHLKPGDIDLIIGHVTGTQVGDAAELACYQSIFGENIPPMILPKWCISHLMGASGAASVALACEQFKCGFLPAHPYMSSETSLGKHREVNAHHILVTALGYGGNAAALILSKV